MFFCFSCFLLHACRGRVCAALTGRASLFVGDHRVVCSVSFFASFFCFSLSLLTCLCLGLISDCVFVFVWVFVSFLCFFFFFLSCFFFYFIFIFFVLWSGECLLRWTCLWRAFCVVCICLRWGSQWRKSFWPESSARVLRRASRHLSCCSTDLLSSSRPTSSDISQDSCSRSRHRQ